MYWFDEKRSYVLIGLLADTRLPEESTYNINVNVNFLKRFTISNIKFSKGSVENIYINTRY